MRRVLTLFLAVALSGTLLAGCGGAGSKPSGSGSDQGAAVSDPNKGGTPDPKPEAPSSKPLQIGLTQIVEHPALDTTRQGIIDALKEAGFEDGKQIKIEFQSAQGEPTNAQQIAQKFEADKKDLIIAIATPSAQAVVQASKKTPILFSAVTDPVSAGLVSSLDKPGANVTGASDAVPVKDQLELFGKLETKVQKVGVIYNAGEANSVALMKEIKEAAPALNLTIVEATVANAAEVQQAAQSLMGRVDGLYLITDNTLAQGVTAVISLANQQGWPTISSVDSYVKQGALATLGLDYYKHGRQTGAMAAELLKGKNPGEMSVQFNEELTLIVNTKTADTIKLAVPAAVLEQAEKVAE